MISVALMRSSTRDIQSDMVPPPESPMTPSFPPSTPGCETAKSIAEYYPVDGEGHEPRLGHDVPVVVAVLLDLFAELLGAVVAHHRLFAERSVTVAGQDGRPPVTR